MHRREAPSNGQPAVEHTCGVGQKHMLCIYIGLARTIYIYIYTLYIRYFWLGNHQIYGVYLRIYTVLANPTVFLAGKSPKVRPFTVYLYGCGQPNVLDLDTSCFPRSMQTAAALGPSYITTQHSFAQAWQWAVHPGVVKTVYKKLAISCAARGCKNGL